MAIKSSQQKGLSGFDSESLVKQQGIRAVGGTISDFGNYRVHTFTGTGQFTVIDPNLNIEYLIVGGGGEGGGSHGGGGGGGGVLTGVLTLSKQSYTITIGAGASAGSTNAVGNLGNTTKAFNLSALGGGGGGYEGVDGSAGASGGGGGGKTTGGAAGTIGQGNNGGVGANSNGYGAGGGGGAASVGGSAVQTSPYSAGNGGNGLLTTITGGTAYFGGGGGGAGYSPNSTTPGTGGLGGGGNGGNYGVATYGTAGAVNTGGGSGGYGQAATAYVGLNGGSGIVIIRYFKTNPQISISKPITNGIKLHLDASNLYSYGNSGTAWNDISGNGINGTLVNAPLYDGANGGVFSFNGTNQTVSISSILNAYPFTISFWASHPTSWVPTTTVMHELLNMSIAGQRVSIGTTNQPGWTNGPSLMYGGTNHWTISATSAGMSTGFTNIVYVVFASNDSRHQIYVNGVAQTMINNGGAHGGTAGWQIASNGSSGEYWPGQIASAQVYNRTLTQTEVIQNYNALRNRFGI